MRKKLSIIFIALSVILAGCNSANNSSTKENSSKIDKSSQIDTSSKTDNSSKIVDSSSQKEEDINLFGIVNDEEYTPPDDGILFAEKYLTQNQISNMKSVFHDGYERYLIVPTSEDIKVEIYDFNELDEIGGIGDILYTSDKGNPILLQCNVSDIHTNVIIRFERGDEVVSYSPRLSLKDGSIILVDGVYELEKLKLETSNDVNLKILKEHLGEDKIKDKSFMRVEDEVIDEKTCVVYKMGTNTDSHFATEEWYAISNDGAVYIYDVVMDEWNIHK